MVFSMVACGEKGTTYKGVGEDYENSTLTINGSSFTLKGSTTESGKDMDMDCEMITNMTISGTVAKKDGNKLELVAKTAKMSMKITGKDAAAFKEMYRGLLSMLEGEEKQVLTDLLDGKTVNVKQGDAYWESLGIDEENLIVTLDEVKGTFEAEE